MEDVLYKRGNVVLGVALAAASGALLYNAVRLLEQVREATRVSKDEPAESTPLLISRHTEDAIKAETLGTLCSSPNYDIRQAATKMLVERVLRTGTYDVLLASLKPARGSAKLQTRALACLRYMHLSSPVTSGVEQQVHAVYALVGFLASRNKQARRRMDSQDTDWRKRPRAERDALAALVALMPSRIPDVLAAGAVTSWLAHYPFGGAKASPERRMEVVRRLCERQSDDLAMALVFNGLMCSPDARRQLRTARLIGSSIGEDISADGLLFHDTGPPASPGLGASSAAGAAAAAAAASFSTPGPQLPRPRARHSSPAATNATDDAGVRRRHRHRQAMVLSELGQPVTRDNIFEGDLPDNAWELPEDSEPDDDDVPYVLNI